MESNIKTLGFILGRDTSLSIAEIFAYLKRQKIQPLSEKLISNVLLIELNQEESSQISINDFGGSIKIFDVLSTHNNAPEIIERLLTLVNDQTEKRINFGISGYGNVNKNFVLKIGYEIKNRLLENHRPARFVTGKTVDLSSVIVNENKLIERGFEAIIIKSGHEWILGRTIAVQDYKAYSKRDFGRPVRDARNGMLPPKLAKIMINLAGASIASTVYDPFCGSGTILQEALFLGYRDIYGSDIEKKNITDSLTNMEWLYRSFGMPLINDEKIFISDVLSPSKKIIANAIVGEGFLGEPIKRRRDKALADANKLAQFYLETLTTLKDQLQDDGTMVIAIPFFIVDKEYFYLPIMDKVKKIGLEAIDYIPNDIEIRRFGRGNLTYSRPDQFVGREILVLKKSS